MIAKFKEFMKGILYKMNEKNVVINIGDFTQFNNEVKYCIGSGRLNLALREGYINSLKMIQNDIGFQYIRAHGLFCEDMGVYQEYTENNEIKVEYVFSYIDRVYDTYLELGLKPFVEIGFMPSKLASGDRTVFFWNGNITPPANYDKWADLVEAVIRHWIERYGIEEVSSWMFEVWNEPNLDVFWENANLKEYLKLYQVTCERIKSVSQFLKVGGPAVCGGNDILWFHEFLGFCSANKVPVDFISRHFYCVEPPEEQGYYVYQKLRSCEMVLKELEESRKIINSFKEYVNLPMHITEFNTSYMSRCPLHDTNLNAAYIAQLLSSMGEFCASYSYWTFSDEFEEEGIPKNIFYGGFGLVSNGGIRKPTYWTFAFFSKLGSKCIYKDKNSVVTMDTKGSIMGIIWNPIYNDIKKEDLMASFSLSCSEGEYILETESVNEENCNPQKTWYDLGNPTSVTKKHYEILNKTSRPLYRISNIKSGGIVNLKFKLKHNEVLYFELNKIFRGTIRGFCPDKIWE